MIIFCGTLVSLPLAFRSYIYSPKQKFEEYVLGGVGLVIFVTPIPFREQSGASKDALRCSRYGDRLHHPLMVWALVHSNVTAMSTQLQLVAVYARLVTWSLHTLFLAIPFTLAPHSRVTCSVIIVRERRLWNTVSVHSFPSATVKEKEAFSAKGKG